MRIQYCSDLHIEFEENSRFLAENPPEISGDVLILAGDIAPLHDRYLKNPFFSFVADHYREVFWIPGNHEFYYRNITDFSSSFNLKIRENVHLLHNVEIDLEGVLFIFSTLWSKISSRNEKEIERSVSDFEYITSNDRRFTAADFNRLHEVSLNFIKQSIRKDSRKMVVVTHHLPSLSCNRPVHNKSNINEAFCIDLTEDIKTSNAKFWIYGHSHFNQKPLIMGKTILLTNQLGYLSMNEKTGFRRNAYFSL